MADQPRADGRPSPGPAPAGAPREAHPDDPAWRADALAQSRHSRLADELRLPEGDLAPERADALCGEVCRIGLRDLAPALILLPAAPRRRVQALAAWAFTLFDFARQPGMAGERLSQINRWEFELEAALEGRPAGQPAFVRMAAEETLSPWPREALDELTRLARRRASRGRPAAGDLREHEARELAAALAGALVGAPAPIPLVALGAVHVRLRQLQDLGEELRRARWPLGEGSAGGEPPSREERAAEVRAECRRLRKLLDAAASGHGDPPPAWLRRAAVYLRLAGGSLVRAIERSPGEAERRPAVLGVGTRLLLLARARLTRR